MKGTPMKLRHIAENKAPFAPGWYPTDDHDIPEVNPDTFYQEEGAVPFIYNNEGLVWSDDSDESHYGLISSYHERFNEHENNVQAIRNDLEDSALVGRISPDGSLVSFWNYPRQLHGMLGKCISALLAADLIYPDTHLILHGFDQTTTASNTKNMGDAETQTKVDPKKERELQLRRELHLMQPQEKKAAMKELGLSFGSRKNPWQKASEKEGLVQPGQKWWAPTSEGKDNRML